MLDISNVDCSTVSLPEFLSPICALTPFLDHSSHISCCFLSETTSFPDHNSSKAAGSLRRSSSPILFHPLIRYSSSQHRYSLTSSGDLLSVQSTFLLVLGRIKSAFDEATNSVKSNPNTTYFKTDLAYDVVSFSASILKPYSKSSIDIRVLDSLYIE
ncbi:hypothetical protein K435DRAFT_868087 [Dendrothele bispora CBS 962.96]|uniref:Uncharacterized protein n=1 Tax=Dendrothele bispora (strain CBS 962.96) TaxID=1314807 RepID=A0A4S8LE00_DENBC|nr:hypothetical protein K435DRAFT_868087 [Dendrothele bispora CBS 962.96]